MLKYIAALLAFSISPLGAQAKTITATGPTLDSAETKIAALADNKGKNYNIIGAQMNNHVYMIAKLTDK